MRQEEAYRQAADARNGFKGELIRLSNMAIDNAKKNNTLLLCLQEDHIIQTHL